MSAEIAGLTDDFSKKWENLELTYTLWFAYYNFCRVHQTLRITPAMEAGITDHLGFPFCLSTANQFSCASPKY